MKRFVAMRAAVCLIAALGLLPLSPAGPARAGLVSTEAVIASAEQGAARDRIRGFLTRDEVRREMARLGVSPDEAARRVESLSDEEVGRIAGHLDTLPAGGDGLGVVIGAAVLIFVILLITDIAGLTKVFPWTRSVR